MTGIGPTAGELRMPLLGAAALIAVVAAILFFLVLPTLIVIPMSVGTAGYIEFPPRGLTLRWYLDYFRDPAWMEATWFSLWIAAATTVTATVVGTLASLALVRGTLPGRELVRALTLGPLVVPHVVLAVAFYLVFAPLGLTGNFVGFLMAHSMLAVPYVVITVSAALERVDPAIEMAARSCGASRLRAFFRVVLPDMAPGIAAGAVFAFLASFDEATVAFFISGIDGKTVTRKMFEDIDFNLTPVIAAVSTVLVLVSVALMGLIEVMRQQGSRRDRRRGGSP